MDIPQNPPASNPQDTPPQPRSILFRPSDIPPLWQYKHMFEPETMFYWNQDGQNYPTQVMAKVMVIKALKEETYEDWGQLGSVDVVARELPIHLPYTFSFTEMMHLMRTLYLWTVNNGLPPALQVPGHADLMNPDSCKIGHLLKCDGWWDWLYPQINWEWIAARLLSELENHWGRRDHRVNELYRSQPVELLETWTTDPTE
jgi:hypothetical protein